MKFKMTRKFIVISMLILSVLFAGDWVTVSRVIDGDTFETSSGEKVRLIGVDTPETKHPAKTVEYFGQEAYEFTKRELEGRKVRLEYDWQKKDKYNRTLAYVYLEDGSFFNAKLIEEGYVHAYTQYPFKQEYMDDFRKLEKEAREAEKGLWASEKSQDNTTLYCQTNRVNIRENPNTKSKILGTLSINDAVTVIGEDGNWYKTTYQGKDAWVYKTYFSEDKIQTGNYWYNSKSGILHNSSCKWYGNTKKGYYTNKVIGKDCGICGGAYRVKVSSTKESGYKYWYNSNSGVLHNSKGMWYGNTKKGYYTNKIIGRDCGICGGAHRVKTYIPKTTGDKYWINTNSGVRHNSSCRWYGNTKKGYYTNEPVGRPCGICGG